MSYKKWIITHDMSIKNMARKLNETEVKVLSVVDQDKLIGSITDGDLRRVIINMSNLESSVTEIMNKSPHYVHADTNIEIIEATLRSSNLLSLPVVDKDMAVVDIITSSATQEFNKIYDNPVVIMAGGFGKRLSPLTNETPKPMLKLGDKPMLEHIIENFKSQGFVNFYISVHFKSEQIISYFQDGKNLNVCIEYLIERQPMGTAGCLSLLDTEILNKPIILTNGDIITSANYEALLEFHSEQNAEITMGIQKYPVNVPFGVVHIEDFAVKSIQEKPFMEFNINTGIYVLNPDIVNNIEPKKIDITDVISSNLQDNKNVCAFPIIENWSDIGQHKDLNIRENYQKN